MFVFVYDFHLEISSFSAKSFPFLFLFIKLKEIFSEWSVCQTTHEVMVQVLVLPPCIRSKTWSTQHRAEK
jgi:hypothetical protein